MKQNSSGDRGLKTARALRRALDSQLLRHGIRSSSVTAPRQIIPGQFYLVTRRCTQRQFLLRPSRITNDIVRYSLALAASQTGVLLHAVCVMSNHWHGVVSDPEGRLPEFQERFHRLVARAQNAALGHVENFWSSDKPSSVLLVSEADVIDKIAYTLANPTAAGLVHSPFEWPGVISHGFRKPQVVEMPDIFFDENGDLPDEVELQFRRPEIFPALTDAALLAEIQDAVAKRVRAIRDEMATQGRKFLGRRAALQQSVFDSPKTPAPRGTPNPRIAAASTPARVQAISRMVEFVRGYRAAWLAWRGGDRSVTFPFGTYAMRLHSSVSCAQPP